jgi:hypothetical protein
MKQSHVKKRKNLSVLRIRDVYPGSWFLSNPDPRSNNSTNRGGGKIFLSSIFCRHKYRKIINNFIFEQAKKFFSSQKTVKIIVRFTQTFVIKLSKDGFGFWDLGSQIKGQKGNGFQIPDPDPQQWNNLYLAFWTGQNENKKLFWYAEVSAAIFYVYRF